VIRFSERQVRQRDARIIHSHQSICMNPFDSGAILIRLGVFGAIHDSRRQTVACEALRNLI
jgi:hypothetical protein